MARAGSCGGDTAGAGRPEPWELSLEEVLKAYEQPLNEEQAWAVCFQGCRGLRGSPGRRLRDTGDLLLRGDGSVGAREPEAAGEAGGGARRRGPRSGASVPPSGGFVPAEGLPPFLERETPPSAGPGAPSLPSPSLLPFFPPSFLCLPGPGRSPPGLPI